MYNSEEDLFDSDYEDVMIEDEVDEEFAGYLKEAYRVIRVRKY